MSVPEEPDMGKVKQEIQCREIVLVEHSLTGLCFPSSCFHTTYAFPLPLSSPFSSFGDSSAVGSTYSTGHRKLVLYDDYVDGGDYQYGHGTHVRRISTIGKGNVVCLLTEYSVLIKNTVYAMGMS